MLLSCYKTTWESKIIIINHTFVGDKIPPRVKRKKNIISCITCRTKHVLFIYLFIFTTLLLLLLGLPSGTIGKEPTSQYRRHKRFRFHPWVGKIPCRRKWQSNLVFLPAKSLTGYIAWVCKDSDKNKRLSTHRQNEDIFLLLLKIKCLNFD